MSSKKIELGKLFPVFLTFIVMGFVDIVGVSTGYVQKDFDLSDSMAQFLPSMVFIWFLIFSIPVGILQDKMGKKKMMNLGIIITILGLLLPFIYYSLLVILIAFVCMGIGNTIIQVAASPLLQEVSPKKKLSSFLSLSQFIKAITSLTGPIIATYLAIIYDKWILVFVVYVLISLANVIWLSMTKIEENIKSESTASFSSCLKLLTNRFVLTMVIAIFLIVGADVGMNSNIQGFMMKLHGLTLENASYGISIYFTALMISRFAGAILLQFLNPVLFLVITTVFAILGALLIMLSSTEMMAYTAIFIVGLGAGNLFPLVFSIAINKMPSRSNEISGLLIMAIVGGAIIPPIMGLISSNLGTLGSLSVLLFCFAYILIIPFSLKQSKS